MDDFKICSETGTKITKSMVIGCISDTFKSVNGFRPRHIDFSLMSFNELGDYLTDLQEQEDVMYIDETRWELEQLKKRDAKVLELIDMGASNKETANRWLEQAEVWS